MKFTEYGCGELRLKADYSLLALIVNELRLLWSRTNGMDRKVREALFVIACDFLKKYDLPEGFKTSSSVLGRVYDDFTNRRFYKYEVDGWLNRFDAGLRK